MFDLIIECFNWMPVPLALLVAGVLLFFCITILVEIIKLLYHLFCFLKDVFGGLISKVVGWFG